MGATRRDGVLPAGVVAKVSPWQLKPSTAAKRRRSKRAEMSPCQGPGVGWLMTDSGCQRAQADPCYLRLHDGAHRDTPEKRD